jgi:hypothetical protein
VVAKLADGLGEGFVVEAGIGKDEIAGHGAPL